MFGFFSADGFHALRVVIHNPDAGIVTGPWKPRHFLEGVGLGLFASALPAEGKARSAAPADVAIAVERGAIEFLVPKHA